MNNKLVSVMNNFSESEIDRLLGELKDSLIEWSIGKEMATKRNKIEIIISVNGLKLFEDEKFKYNFFSALPENDCKEIATHFGISAESFDQGKVAYKLSKIKFADNEGYNYLIKNYFEIVDYNFAEAVKGSKVDVIGKLGVSNFYELFDYQYMIKQKVVNDLANPNLRLTKILIHMPTGTGKTKTTMHIISHYLNFVSKNKGIIVWIAHTNELLQQAYETFQTVWSHLGTFDVNVFKGWIEFPTDISNGVLFTTIQSLQTKMGSSILKDIADNASLIIFDEVHKAGASKYKECVDYLMKIDNNFNKKFIGLTATPGRVTEISRENKLFSDEFERSVEINVDLVNMISLSKAEAENYQGSKEIIPYFQENRYLAVLKRENLDYDLDAVLLAKIKKDLESKKEDFSPTLIQEISLNKARNIKIVEKLKELNSNNIPTIVFACSLQHAKMLSAFLRLLGISNSLVHGELAWFDRQKAISDFKTGKVNIIINFDILTTGFDSTNIKCVFITRPTKSVILYSQMIGRGLRGPKMGGNKECKLIDVKENLNSFADENAAFRHFDQYWR